MNRNQLEKIISDAWEARNNINTETTGEKNEANIINHDDFSPR